MKITIGYEEVDAIPVSFPGFEEFNFALHQTLTGDDFAVSEVVSGLRIASSESTNIYNAYNAAFDALNSKGLDFVRQHIKGIHLHIATE